MKTGTNKLLTLIGLKIQGDLGPITCYTSKRNRVVWYLKAPPKDPPSWQQVDQRNLFQMIGWAWQALGAINQTVWNAAAAAANLRISGFNLFSYLYVTGDESVIETIEHQTGLSLPRGLE